MTPQKFSDFLLPASLAGQESHLNEASMPRLDLLLNGTKVGHSPRWLTSPLLEEQSPGQEFCGPHAFRESETCN